MERKSSASKGRHGIRKRSNHGMTASRKSKKASLIFSEMTAYANRLNSLLKDEELISDLLPIEDGDDLAAKLSDGRLMACFLSKMPGYSSSLDPNSLHKGKVNVFKRQANCAKVIEASKAMGINLKVVNIDAQDLAENRSPTLTLSYIRQNIIFHTFASLSEVIGATESSLSSIQKFKCEDLKDKDASGSAPDKAYMDNFLAEFLNEMLLKAKSDFCVSNRKDIAENLKDCNIYAVVLGYLSGNSPMTALWSEEMERAEIVIQFADSIGVDTFIDAIDLLGGDSHIHAAFVGEIARCAAKLGKEEEQSNARKYRLHSIMDVLVEEPEQMENVLEWVREEDLLDYGDIDIVQAANQHPLSEEQVRQLRDELAPDADFFYNPTAAQMALQNQKRRETGLKDSVKKDFEDVSVGNKKDMFENPDSPTDSMSSYDADALIALRRQTEEDEEEEPARTNMTSTTDLAHQELEKAESLSIREKLRRFREEENRAKEAEKQRSRSPSKTPKSSRFANNRSRFESVEEMPDPRDLRSRLRKAEASTAAKPQEDDADGPQHWRSGLKGQEKLAFQRSSSASPRKGTRDMGESIRLNREARYFSEMTSYANRFNFLLAGDPLVKHHLMLRDGDDLAEKLSDGLLCAAFLSRLPGYEDCIDLGKMMRQNLDVYKKQSNQTIMLESCENIGVNLKVVNIDSLDLVENRNPVLTLSFLRQLMMFQTVSVLTKLMQSTQSTLTSLDAFRAKSSNDDGSMAAFAMPSKGKLDAIWIQMLNEILERIGSNVRIPIDKKLADALSDCKIYTRVLAYFNELPPHEMLKQTTTRRADNVIDMAERCGMNVFITADDLMHGDSHVHSAFVGEIARVAAEMKASEEEMKILRGQLNQCLDDNVMNRSFNVDELLEKAQSMGVEDELISKVRERSRSSQMKSLRNRFESIGSEKESKTVERKTSIITGDSGFKKAKQQFDLLDNRDQYAAKIQAIIDHDPIGRYEELEAMYGKAVELKVPSDLQGLMQHYIWKGKNEVQKRIAREQYMRELDRSWIAFLNRILAQANRADMMIDVDADLADALMDSTVYAVVLSYFDDSSPQEALSLETDHHRAEFILKQAAQSKIELFFEADDILSGASDVHQAIVAEIAKAFRNKKQLAIEEEEAAARLQEMLAAAKSDPKKAKIISDAIESQGLTNGAAFLDLATGWNEEDTIISDLVSKKLHGYVQSSNAAIQDDDNIEDYFEAAKKMGVSKSLVDEAWEKTAEGIIDHLADWFEDGGDNEEARRLLKRAEKLKLENDADFKKAKDKFQFIDYKVRFQAKVQAILDDDPLGRRLELEEMLEEAQRLPLPSYIIAQMLHFIWKGRNLETKAKAKEKYRQELNETLIAFLNEILEQSGSDLRVSRDIKFSDSLRDANVYATVLSYLHDISPQPLLDEPSTRKRMTSVLDLGSSAGIQMYLSPDDLLEGDCDIHQAFVGEIVQAFRTKEHLLSAELLSKLEEELPTVEHKTNDRIHQLLYDSVHDVAGSKVSIWDEVQEDDFDDAEVNAGKQLSHGMLMNKKTEPHLATLRDSDSEIGSEGGEEQSVVYGANDTKQTTPNDPRQFGESSYGAVEDQSAANGGDADVKYGAMFDREVQLEEEEMKSYVAHPNTDAELQDGTTVDNPDMEKHLSMKKQRDSSSHPDEYDYEDEKYGGNAVSMQRKNPDESFGTKGSKKQEDELSSADSHDADPLQVLGADGISRRELKAEEYQSDDLDGVEEDRTLDLAAFAQGALHSSEQVYSDDAETPDEDTKVPHEAEESVVGSESHVEVTEEKYDGFDVKEVSPADESTYSEEQGLEHHDEKVQEEEALPRESPILAESEGTQFESMSAEEKDTLEQGDKPGVTHEEETVAIDDDTVQYEDSSTLDDNETTDVLQESSTRDAEEATEDDVMAAESDIRDATLASREDHSSPEQDSVDDEHRDTSLNHEHVEFDPVGQIDPEATEEEHAAAAHADVSDAADIAEDDGEDHSDLIHEESSLAADDAQPDLAADSTTLDSVVDGTVEDHALEHEEAVVPVTEEKNENTVSVETKYGEANPLRFDQEQVQGSESASEAFSMEANSPSSLQSHLDNADSMYGPDDVTDGGSDNYGLHQLMQSSSSSLDFETEDAAVGSIMNEAEDVVSADPEPAHDEAVLAALSDSKDDNMNAAEETEARSSNHDHGDVAVAEELQAEQDEDLQVDSVSHSESNDAVSPSAEQDEVDHVMTAIDDSTPVAQLQESDNDIPVEVVDDHVVETIDATDVDVDEVADPSEHPVLSTEESLKDSGDSDNFDILLGRDFLSKLDDDEPETRDRGFSDPDASIERPQRLEDGIARDTHDPNAVVEAPSDMMLADADDVADEPETRERGFSDPDAPIERPQRLGDGITEETDEPSVIDESSSVMMLADDGEPVDDEPETRDRGFSDPDAPIERPQRLEDGIARDTHDPNAVVEAPSDMMLADADDEPETRERGFSDPDAPIERPQRLGDGITEETDEPSVIDESSSVIMLADDGEPVDDESETRDRGFSDPDAPIERPQRMLDHEEPSSRQEPIQPLAPSEAMDQEETILVDDDLQPRDRGFSDPDAPMERPQRPKMESDEQQEAPYDTNASSPVEMLDNTAQVSDDEPAEREFSDVTAPVERRRMDASIDEDLGRLLAKENTTIDPFATEPDAAAHQERSNDDGETRRQFEDNFDMPDRRQRNGDEEEEDDGMPQLESRHIIPYKDTFDYSKYETPSKAAKTFTMPERKTRKIEPVEVTVNPVEVKHIPETVIEPFHFPKEKPVAKKKNAAFLRSGYRYRSDLNIDADSLGTSTVTDWHGKTVKGIRDNDVKASTYIAKIPGDELTLGLPEIVQTLTASLTDSMFQNKYPFLVRDVCRALHECLSSKEMAYDVSDFIALATTLVAVQPPQELLQSTPRHEIVGVNASTLIHCFMFCAGDTDAKAQKAMVRLACELLEHGIGCSKQNELERRTWALLKNRSQHTEKKTAVLLIELADDVLDRKAYFKALGILSELHVYAFINNVQKVLKMVSDDPKLLSPALTIYRKVCIQNGNACSAVLSSLPDYITDQSVQSQILDFAIATCKRGHKAALYAFQAVLACPAEHDNLFQKESNAKKFAELAVIFSRKYRTESCQEHALQSLYPVCQQVSDDKLIFVVTCIRSIVDVNEKHGIRVLQNVFSPLLTQWSDSSSSKLLSLVEPWAPRAE